ncbi:hypothetical protein HPB47_018812, partial [Ixodes persulcatus]
QGRSSYVGTRHATWGSRLIQHKVFASGRFQQPQAMALESKFYQRVLGPGVSPS